MKLVRLPYVLLVLLLPVSAVDAQFLQTSRPADELFRTISSLDNALFDAFNRCDLEKFATLVADDVEFYHDNSGLTRSGKSVVESVKNNICGKVRRELNRGTLEVYPIPGFGAVELGVHRFFELKSGPGAIASGEAKFVHLWQFKDGVWKITRVVSYAHVALDK